MCVSVFELNYFNPIGLTSNDDDIKLLKLIYFTNDRLAN